MNQLIIGALIAIISAIIGAIVGPMIHILYESRREKRKTRNESLRNHFKDLETRIIKPRSDIVQGIRNVEGSLSIKGASYGSSMYATLTRDFEQEEFHIFKLHFPKQAEKATKLMSNVNKHNELCESFISKLKELIEEKTGLPVRDGNGPPFIYTSVPYNFRQTLCQLIEEKSLRHDFRQATIEKKNELWEVHTVSTIYATVKTEGEAKSCKSGLIKLMESTSLQEETSSILKKAKQLENEARSFADLLDFICWQYRESEQLLNEERDCPYCQVIFQRKKEK